MAAPLRAGEWVRPLRAGEWDPDDHPRDERGRFTDKDAALVANVKGQMDAAYRATSAKADANAAINAAAHVAERWARASPMAPTEMRDLAFRMPRADATDQYLFAAILREAERKAVDEVPTPDGPMFKPGWVAALKQNLRDGALGFAPPGLVDDEGGRPDMDLATYFPAAQRKVEELVRGADVWVRVKADTVPAILADGRLKTQHEVEAGLNYDPPLRARIESEMFTDTPVYGYLSRTGGFAGDGAGVGYGSQAHMLSFYGDVAFKLKPGVRDRTTFIFGDTVTDTEGGNIAEVAPSLVTKPSALSAVNLGRDLLDVKDIGDISPYVEAQVHGKVGLDDVAEAVFRHDPDAATRALLGGHGIRWRVVGAAPGAGEFAEHSGMLVALWLDPDAARAVAVEGGEPADGMHVTLAYVKDWDARRREKALAALRALAAGTPPLVGAIMGDGRFPPSEATDGRAVLWAKPGIPRVHVLRERVVRALADAGLVAAEHADGYTPHVTRKYVDPDDPNWTDAAPTVPLRFDALTVIAGDRVDLPFGAPLRAGEFDPEKHPRDPDTGRFVVSGGGEAEAAQPRIDWKAKYPNLDLRYGARVAVNTDAGARIIGVVEGRHDDGTITVKPPPKFAGDVRTYRGTPEAAATPDAGGSAQGRAWAKAAREFFGVTTDPREGGYILADGGMLDFSGKKEGGSPGTRSYDHREVGRASDDMVGGSDGMIAFAREAGAIRMSYSGGELFVDFYAPPTAAQEVAIQRIARGPITYDVNDARGDVIAAGTIDDPAETDRLFGIVARHYRAKPLKAGEWNPDDHPRGKTTEASTEPRNAPLTAGEWVEDDHPREPAGSPDGGQFAPKDGDAGLVEVGITSSRTGTEPPAEVGRALQRAMADLTAAGVRGVHGSLGEGAWVDRERPGEPIMTEPTWILRYRAGDAPAIETLKAIAARHGQYAVLLVNRARWGEAGVVPRFRWHLGDLGASDRAKVGAAAKAAGLPGWTYSPRHGTLVSNPIPQWGQTTKAHALAAHRLTTALRAAGFAPRTDKVAVRVGVLQRNDDGEGYRQFREATKGRCCCDAGTDTGGIGRHVPGGGARRRAGRDGSDVRPAQAVLTAGEWDPAEHPRDDRGRFTATDSPEFKAWFGDSKVVDAAGKPLVVYHGTHGDVQAFDPEKIGSWAKHGQSELGFFFAPNPEEAANYAGQYYGVGVSTHDLSVDDPFDHSFNPPRPKSNFGGNIMPVYLSVTNPYEMPLREFYRIAVPSEGKAMRARLELAGYDGIKLVGPADPLHGGVEMGTFIAFRPSQIKSAIGNRGTFDPKSPRIDHDEAPLRAGEWDPEKHPRGKTTEKSNEGSFAPGEGGGGVYTSQDVADAFERQGLGMVRPALDAIAERTRRVMDSMQGAHTSEKYLAAIRGSQGPMRDALRAAPDEPAGAIAAAAMGLELGFDADVVVGWRDAVGRAVVGWDKEPGKAMRAVVADMMGGDLWAGNGDRLDAAEAKALVNRFYADHGGKEVVQNLLRASMAFEQERLRTVIAEWGTPLLKAKYDPKTDTLTAYRGLVVPKSEVASLSRRRTFALGANSSVSLSREKAELFARGWSVAVSRSGLDPRDIYPELRGDEAGVLVEVKVPLKNVFGSFFGSAGESGVQEVMVAGDETRIKGKVIGTYAGPLRRPWHERIEPTPVTHGEEDEGGGDDDEEREEPYPLDRDAINRNWLERLRGGK